MRYLVDDKLSGLKKVVNNARVSDARRVTENAEDEEPRRAASGVLSRDYGEPSATLDDIREAVTTFEEIEPVARRVLGGAHPITVDIECDMRNARAVAAEAV